MGSGTSSGKRSNAELRRSIFQQATAAADAKRGTKPATEVEIGSDTYEYSLSVKINPTPAEYENPGAVKYVDLYDRNGTLVEHATSSARINEIMSTDDFDSRVVKETQNKRKQRGVQIVQFNKKGR